MAALEVSPSVPGNLLSSPGTALGIALIALTVLILYKPIYNLYLHPLHSFPGPLLSRATPLPYMLSLTTGHLPFDVLALHQRYGPVVRIGPGELVFADTRAWKDIYGHRAPGEDEFPKSARFYRAARSKGQGETLVSEGRERHGQLRRQLAHGFSERSMREQQPIIRRYVDLLVRRLRENCGEGARSVDMVHWYNYTSFDIIGDLTFGEGFNCLETGQYDPWVRMIFQSIKLGAYMQAANFAPWLKRAILTTVPKGLVEKRKEHLRLTQEKLLKRIDLGAGRADLIEGLIRNKEKLGLSNEELRANCGLLIVAGSETTATLLSGVTYLLGMNPGALAKLTKEVRTSFESEEEIDFASVSSLHYMLACLNEAMRIYPPAPLGMPREVPKGGGIVAGKHVAEGTVVSCFHYALYHNEKFFASPEEFHPERWLGDPRFANDDREIFQPFHIGPRNCIGRNLSYIEMRLILARVLWNFDIKLAEESRDWIGEQKIYLLWEKGPLNVFLTPRCKE